MFLCLSFVLGVDDSRGKGRFWVSGERGFFFSDGLFSFVFRGMGRTLLETLVVF